MKILYGTANPSKLESMKRITGTLGIEIVGPAEMGLTLPEVQETGSSPLENACLKAQAYYREFRIPVFSCDTGLYFDELPDSEQPGTHVRRVNGKTLTDREMTEYYGALADAHGGALTGRYRNAVCFIFDADNIFTSMAEGLYTEPFLLVSTPHERSAEGFPLDRLSVDIATGKYYYDLTDHSVD